MMGADAGIRHREIWAVGPGGIEVRQDPMGVEAPLEIRLGLVTPTGVERQTLSVTLRTPGEDEALAVGYLHAEGVIRTRDQIASVGPCGAGGQRLRVDLIPGMTVDLERFSRSGPASAACGACGKRSIAALLPPEIPPLPALDDPIDAAVIYGLGGALRQGQPRFQVTGALHAAGLFDAQGRQVEVAEDVGRHNAVDKVVGQRILAGQSPALPLLAVSGRAGFELIQKAMMAGISVFCALGAPSDLAVEMAEGHGMTLIGFLGRSRFNIYSHPAAIRL